MKLIGIITEISDDNKPAKNGKPAIYKKVATIDLLNGQSANIEFLKHLRQLLIKGFKVNDKVEVEYELRGRKNKLGKPFNNMIAKSIQRL